MYRLAEWIGISSSAAWKTCRDDLSLFPYKMQPSQPLVEAGMARRYAFMRDYGSLMEDNPGVLYITWFSHDTESHFGCYNA
jgi:hypothetical protein